MFLISLLLNNWRESNTNISIVWSHTSYYCSVMELYKESYYGAMNCKEHLFTISTVLWFSSRGIEPDKMYISLCAWSERQNWSRDFRIERSYMKRNLMLHSTRTTRNALVGVRSLSPFQFPFLESSGKWESAGICIVASWNLKWDSLYYISITFCVKYFLAAGQEVRLWEGFLQEQHRFLNRRIKTLSSHHPPTRFCTLAGVLIAAWGTIVLPPLQILWQKYYQDWSGPHWAQQRTSTGSLQSLGSHAREWSNVHFLLRML